MPPAPKAEGPPRALRTPVEQLPIVSDAVGAEIWIKRDDLSHPLYGGNKVRKLELILQHAQTRRATDLVTIGAIGSNHVLATALHAGAMGLHVHALLLPHPYSKFAHQKAAAAARAGAELIPVSGPLALPNAIRRTFASIRRGGGRPLFVPAGGTGRLGTRAFANAARELAEQVRTGPLPWPDAIFVALGSGGTAAGIWGGLSVLQSPSIVHAVRVVPHRFVGRAYLHMLALRALGLQPRRRGLVVVTDQLGTGYGRPTAGAEEAYSLFARDQIHLDLTYTGKAAAALLAYARRSGGGQRLLLWHTLSLPQPFAEDATPEELPREVARLWED